MLGTSRGDMKTSSPNDSVCVSAYKNASTVNMISTIRWSAMHNVISCGQNVVVEIKDGRRYMAA